MSAFHVLNRWLCSLETSRCRIFCRIRCSCQFYSKRLPLMVKMLLKVSFKNTQKTCHKNYFHLSPILNFSSKNTAYSSFSKNTSKYVKYADCNFFILAVKYVKKYVKIRKKYVRILLKNTLAPSFYRSFWQKKNFAKPLIWGTARLVSLSWFTGYRVSRLKFEKLAQN